MQQINTGNKQNEEERIGSEEELQTEERGQ